MAEVHFVHVSKDYGNGEIAVRDLSLAIEDREFFVLLGPSGCGKSTLLKMLAGLETVTEGEIYVDRQLINYVPPGKRGVSMVFQNYALYPHMTVRENIAFPLRMARRKKHEIDPAVREIAEMVALDALLERPVSQLSGGQRQRVALARALIRRPRVTLMDEPLSNLDALLRVQTREELMKLHRSVPGTIIYVTHDQVEALTMGDRIGIMRDGNLVQVGTPEDVYHRPANVFVAGFVGSPRMNLIEGRFQNTAAATSFETGRFGLPLSEPLDAASTAPIRTLGLRPEALMLTDTDEGPARGIVKLVEMTGADRYAFVDLDGVELCVRADAQNRVGEGDSVGLAIRGEIHGFDEDGTRVTIAGTREGSLSAAQ